jgi:hypothetical protein
VRKPGSRLRAALAPAERDFFGLLDKAAENLVRLKKAVERLAAAIATADGAVAKSV